MFPESFGSLAPADPRSAQAASRAGANADPIGGNLNHDDTTGRQSSTRLRFQPGQLAERGARESSRHTGSAIEASLGMLLIGKHDASWSRSRRLACARRFDGTLFRRCPRRLLRAPAASKQVSRGVIDGNRKFNTISRVGARPARFLAAACDDQVSNRFRIIRTTAGTLTGRMRSG